MSIIEPSLANGAVKVELVEAWSALGANHTRSDWIYTGDTAYITFEISSATSTTWSGDVTIRGMTQKDQPADNATAATGEEYHELTAPGHKVYSIFFTDTTNLDSVPTWMQIRIADISVTSTCNCNIKIVRFKRTD